MKNLFTYLKTLWSSMGNLQSSDVSLDRRLTVGSPSGLDAKWKQNPFMRFAVVLTLIFSIGAGNVWGTDATSNFSSNALAVGSGEPTWSTSVNATGFESSSYARGVTWGSGKDPVLTSSTITGTITKVTVVASTNAGASKVSLSVSVGSTAFSPASTYVTSGTADCNSPYEFTGSATGTVYVSLNNSVSNKTAWIKSITITYSSGTTYTVSYNANGGSGSMSNSTGTNITLRTNTFSRTGYSFTGWNTAANGSGASYTDGQTGINANLTLYAQWSCISPTINTHPSSANYDVGDTPSALSVSASLSSGTMTYLWKVSTDGGSTWSNASGTNNAATYAAANISTAAAGTTKYKCIVTNSTASCSTESNVATITVSAPATPATVHLENYSGSDPTGLHVGDSYTLPGSNSFSCGGKTFVGWSSVEIATPGSKPSSNYYEPGESATISSASMTFYAVFADASGGGGSSTVFSEDFSACTNTGGNDGSWSGSVASGTLPTSISSTWTTAYGYAADACIKLGSGSSTGSATTPSIDCGSATSATLTFKAGAWDNKDDGTTLSLTFTHCSGDKSSVTMVKGDWTSYEVALSNISDDITIQFSSTAGSKHRFFLDDIEVVTSGGGPTYSNYTTACASCSYQVTLSKTTPSNGSFTLSSADGSYENCTTGFSVTVSDITPVSGYVLDQVSESTGNSNISGPDGSGNYTVTYTADMDITSAISVTFKPVCATPTFSPAAGTYSSSQSVTISCATDDAVIHYTTDGSTPTASSPTYSSAITVSDDMTIKAIAIKTNYANSEVASAAYKIMDCDWYESFDECAGEGGNDGHFTTPSSIGNSSKTIDNDGWTFTNTTNGGGNKCIKLGTSSNKGTATTPSITVDNGATGKVKFRMAPWDTGKAQITLTGAEISSGVSTWESATNMTAEEWNDYTVNFTTTSTSLKITFQGSAYRTWLDEVCVKMDPVAYTVTFDANDHGTAPDPITDVTKGSKISKPTPDPSATGWTFGGWYKEPACTNAWTWATDQVTSNITLYAKWTCSNPTSLSISETNSKGDFCAGESMTLTVSGSNIGAGATYQWKKGGIAIVGAPNSATYTVASMTRDDAGTYSCTVSNGDCSATSSDYGVKVWTLYINNGAADAYQHLNFTNTGTGTGSNTAVALSSDKGYQFKINNGYDGDGNWFGNSGTITANVSNWTFATDKGNCNLTSGLEGNYTFTLDYSDAGNPKVSVTYPVGNQTANYDIWFDKSVVTGWDVAQTSDLFLRIGKSSNNKNNVTDDVSWSLVPGTDRFYTIKTLAYTGFEAWQIANNVSHSGNNSIYMVNGSGYAITKATDFQKYVVGSTGVTVVPTSSHNTESGCNYWYVSKTDGMLTHTATITTPSHGTIHLAYTDINSAAQDKTSTTAGLAHRTKITATATPDPGYELSTFTVTPSGESPQNITSGVTDNHILAKDATFAATFTAKTITITWNVNGGSSVSPATSSYTYDGSTVALATATHATKIFAGWWTDPSAGTQITEIGTTNKPTADVTYYAHWSDGNTVYFNPGAGTVSPDHATQTTIGGSVSLPTPTPTCPGWTFQGWKVGSEQSDVTSLPDGLVTGSYVPASATVQMYAVYKKTFEETTPHTSTYDWDNTVTGWSGDWTNITQNKGTMGVESSYCGQFSANGAYVQFSTKVKVKNFSLYMRRSSNNTKGTGKIQKSTDGSSWTDVLTWSMSDIEKDACTQKTTTFDGSTEYYVRFFYVADGSAIRYIDNVSITYNTVADVTHYVTSPLECSQVATPVITPVGNTYTGAQTITITCATDGATIYYTTDGTDPSDSNGTTIDSGSSFTLSCSGTVKAIAYKSGMTESNIASETYTLTVPDPTFSPDGGDFKVAQSVTLSNAMAGATVYYEYTTDGSTPSDPTSSSTAYSSTPIPVAVGQTVRIKAIGINACATSSAIVSKTFRVGWNFELVTTEDDLNAGDKLVIVNGTTNALSTYNEAGNNRTSTSDFDLSGTTVTAYPPSSNGATTVQVITLAGEPGDWKLKTTDTKWFNCPSAGKLTTVTTDGNSRKWTIDIGSGPNYYATITNNQETTATIQYGGAVFAAYATSQSPVKIYSIPNPDPVIKVEAELEAFAACYGNAGTYQSFYVSGKNLDGNIVISGPTGYEFCLTSDGSYTATLSLTPTTKTVAKTTVYVRLAATATAGAHNGNLNAAVSANSLSTDVAVTGSVSTADTYTDQVHNTVVVNQCGEYYAPSCPDASSPADESCVETHFKFMGWLTETDKNASGVKDDAWYIAHLITAGTAMTANGTNYYAVWAKEED